MYTYRYLTIHICMYIFIYMCVYICVCIHLYTAQKNKGNTKITLPRSPRLNITVENSLHSGIS